jgi:ribosomal protein L13
MESEIAAVLKATRQVEADSPIGQRLRAEKPDELVQRFRRDAHEVVDIFLDVFSFSLNSVNRVAKAVVAPAEKAEPNVHKVSTSDMRSIVTAPKSVKAGELAEIPISFENSGNAPTTKSNSSALPLSDSGERLVASLVKFMPPSLKIGANQIEKVTVVIAVPKETKHGVYTGLVLASNLNQLRSEIILDVE